MGFSFHDESSLKETAEILRFTPPNGSVSNSSLDIGITGYIDSEERREDKDDP